MSVCTELLRLVHEMKKLLEKELSSKPSSWSANAYKKPNPTGKEEHITADQIEEIAFLCSAHGHLLENMLNALQLKGLEYMPRADYRKNIERLRKIIRATREVTPPIDG